MDKTEELHRMSMLDILKLETDNEDLMKARLVREKGYPNRFGARIPVESNWKLDKFAELLHGYEDKEVVEWLRYGWPSGRLPTAIKPSRTFKNHKGAKDHPEALKKYITKETKKGAVLGPFKAIPFMDIDKVGISPISTRPKKHTTERRIIVDLSFPEGGAVNDGMIKDNYLGLNIQLKFPKTDDLALRVYQLGHNTYMYKVDLSRYFRQLPMDPGDYSLVGYIINGQLYFDKVLPMGMRTAPYIAQRVTDAIRHIHQELSFFLLNYVDDFLGAELQHRVWDAFHNLVNLLEDIGVETAPDKVVPPTTRIEFLGIIYDSKKMTMEVPEDKLQDLNTELHTWLYKTKATRKEVESLIGKLQFASKCVRAGRIFMSRLINWLRELPRTGRNHVPVEARKDVAWWGRLMQTYNGVSIIWLHKDPVTDSILASDASKKGYGAFLSKHNTYLRGEFPKEMQDRNIADLEMLAVLISLKAWGTRLTGRYFWIHVDNEAVAQVINSGRSRDLFLQNALREITMLAALHQFVIKAKHISGISNRIPDWLSRWAQTECRQQFNKFSRVNNLTRTITTPDMLQFNNKW